MAHNVSPDGSPLSVAVIGVDDLERSTTFYGDVIGLDADPAGTWSGAAFERLWHLPKGASATAVFCHAGPSPVGRVLLLDFAASDACPQPGIVEGETINVVFTCAHVGKEHFGFRGILLQQCKLGLFNYQTHIFGMIDRMLFQKCLELANFLCLAKLPTHLLKRHYAIGRTAIGILRFPICQHIVHERTERVAAIGMLELFPGLSHQRNRFVGFVAEDLQSRIVKIEFRIFRPLRPMRFEEFLEAINIFLVEQHGGKAPKIVLLQTEIAICIHGFANLVMRL